MNFPDAFTLDVNSGGPQHQRLVVEILVVAGFEARLTNAFSKNYLNHCAAVAIYAAHYNLCRVHEALRVTPAMQLGVTDHIWTIGELVAAALEGVVPEPQGRKVGRFTVIAGGKGGQ